MKSKIITIANDRKSGIERLSIFFATGAAVFAEVKASRKFVVNEEKYL